MLQFLSTAFLVNFHIQESDWELRSSPTALLVTPRVFLIDFLKKKVVVKIV